jgi:RNA polymerase sigma-70 factor (ECF subfamily)
MGSAWQNWRDLFVENNDRAMLRVQETADDVAFARLMRRWEPPIQRLCVRMLGDTHRAEDLSQEVFTRVFARHREYRPSGKFSTWIWRIALNLCYDELRRRQRRPEEPLDPDPDDEHSGWAREPVSPEAPPDAAAAHGDQAALVRAALLRLPESYRSVVVLRHYEDLKFREIAEVLGIPEGTVKSRMAEAMLLLTRWLTPALQQENTAPAARRLNSPPLCRKALA